MKILLHPLTSLKATFPVRKSEWVLGLATAAFWVLFTIREDLFTSNPSYNGLLFLAPQWVWSWFCFAVGVGRLVSLFINGAYWRTPHARAFFAFLNCFLWFNLLSGLSINLSLGMIFSTTLFIIDAFNFKQAFNEAAASESIRNVERSSHSARPSR